MMRSGGGGDLTTCFDTLVPRNRPFDARPSLVINGAFPRALSPTAPLLHSRIICFFASERFAVADKLSVPCFTLMLRLSTALTELELLSDTASYTLINDQRTRFVFSTSLRLS